jgi:hypothetical protein
MRACRSRRSTLGSIRTQVITRTQLPVAPVNERLELPLVHVFPGSYLELVSGGDALDPADRRHEPPDRPQVGMQRGAGPGWRIIAPQRADQEIGAEWSPSVTRKVLSSARCLGCRTYKCLPSAKVMSSGPSTRKSTGWHLPVSMREPTP